MSSSIGILLSIYRVPSSFHVLLTQKHVIVVRLRGRGALGILQDTQNSFDWLDNNNNWINYGETVCPWLLDCSCWVEIWCFSDGRWTPSKERFLAATQHWRMEGEKNGNETFRWNETDVQIYPVLSVKSSQLRMNPPHPANDDRRLLYWCEKKWRNGAAAANKTRQDVERRRCLSTANVWKRVGSLIKGYNQVEMMSYSPSICCLWFLICEHFFTAVKFDLSGNGPCLFVRKCKFMLKKRKRSMIWGVNKTSLSFIIQWTPESFVNYK